MGRKESNQTNKTLNFIQTFLYEPCSTFVVYKQQSPVFLRWGLYIIAAVYSL